jgi:endonuclease YncB( thermonuclease family)
MAIIRWAEGVLPPPWSGRAVYVYDGDTMLVTGLTGRRCVRVWGIDAPEVGQAFFREARDHLRAYVKGRLLTVVPGQVDKYGRIVAVVIPGHGDSVAVEMLRAGLAWWEYRFAPREAVYKAWQASARSARAGIWSQERWGWAPWVFRARRLRR